MNKKKILVFIVTYNSSFRLKKILNKLNNLKNKISFDTLISDDASNDDTKRYFPTKKNAYFLNVNKKNLGYGGNVKKCLNFALKKKYSYALMIHGDNQYDCRYIIKLYNKLLKENADAVTGSRMKNLSNALSGKMPFYKFLGNIVLTKFFNFMFKTNFTDAHSGLWLYNLKTIKSIGLTDIEDNFNFDNQLRIKLVSKKKKIVEIPIKTYYRNEKSSFHFVYAFKFITDIIKDKIK